MGIKKNEDATEQVVNEATETGFNGPVVYLGETIKGVAISGRVYSEMPSELKEWIKKVPQLRYFVANVDDLAEATKNAERLKDLSRDIVKIIEDEKKKGE